ncbi:FMN reductase (NADPH) [bioreactor metagenome]|uniref:FMN reductase (NADPH) n=1 Tax=bioreactor metagenome TaxID=1076179 RepID=A0A644T917_9ZZZZ|nr:nitroreductase [Negativicutes bacterium]
MNLTEAIKGRRSVRRYTEQQLDKNIVDKLLNAAIQAPTATNAQPWAFSVVQNPKLLKQFSDAAKKQLLEVAEQNPQLEKYRPALSKPAFNIFYNAQTLIVIYGKSDTPHPIEDCSMAAQNLMLTAHSLGLGTCWIGFALPFLSLPETKRLLNIPADYIPVAPLIIGYPDGTMPLIEKSPPKIFSWQ